MQLIRQSRAFAVLVGLTLGSLLVGQPEKAGAAPAALQPADAPAAERRFTPAELRSDLDQLYRQLQAAHFNLYAFTPRRDLDRAFRRSRAQLQQPLTRLEAKIQFELFAAQVRMGHTRVASPMPEWQAYLDAGGRSFPLMLRILGKRCFVAANLSGLSQLHAGDELLTLDGRPMREWLARTGRHVSAETTYMAHSLLEYDFAIYLWVELGAAESYLIETRDASGATKHMRLSGRTRAEMAAAGAQQPAALDLEHPLRDARMLDTKLAYLRPGPFYNAEAKTAVEQWDVSGFRAFIDKAFESFHASGAQRLIIDLRGNPGGDNLFSDVLVAWVATKPFRFASAFRIKVSAESIAANSRRIAQDAAAAGPVSQQFAALYSGARIGDIVDFTIPLTAPRPQGAFSGKTYVLIDRQSYSNAVAVAALIQDYRFGVILGEETSDMATTYGAMEQFQLDNTGLMVGYPKAQIVRPNGRLQARGVVPDVAIEIPVLQDPTDPVLRRAMEIAAAN